MAIPTSGITSARDDNGIPSLMVADPIDPSRPIVVYGNKDNHTIWVEQFIENIANISTPIFAASLIIKTTSGRLKGLTGYNSKGTSQFIQLHDASSLPQENAIPKVTMIVSATSNFSLDYGVVGRYFSVGIVVCNSSTALTKTIGSADISIDAQYV